MPKNITIFALVFCLTASSLQGQNTATIGGVEDIEADGDGWGSSARVGLLYVLSIASAYVVDAVVGKTIDGWSHIRDKSQPTIKRYVALKAGISWVSNTVVRGLFGPLRDKIDEGTKFLNAGLTEWHTETATPPGIAEANEAFIAWAEFMNSHYSIRAQMSRANATRSLLYIEEAANSARHAFETGHEQIAVELIADAAFHLRNLYGEFAANNETVAQRIRNNFTLVSDLPANFGELVLRALSFQDPHMDDAQVAMAYWNALRAWKIIDSDTQLQYDGGDQCPAFNLEHKSDVQTAKQSGWLTPIFTYGPGFATNIGLETLEAAGVVPSFIKAVKGPLVTALSDKPAKSIESKVQKAVYGFKNSHHAPLKGDIAVLSDEFDDAQAASYDLYTQKTQNGRANFARTMATLASSLNTARNYALDKNNFEKAAHFVATAAANYRRTHNEAPIDFPFVVGAVHAIISNHLEWPGYFGEMLLEKVSTLDPMCAEDEEVQQYYEHLFAAWNIPFEIAA